MEAAPPRGAAERPRRGSGAAWRPESTRVRRELRAPAGHGADPEGMAASAVGVRAERVGAGPEGDRPPGRAAEGDAGGAVDSRTGQAEVVLGRPVVDRDG